MYFQSEWKTVWVLTRWFCQKPADLELQCFHRWINPLSLYSPALKVGLHIGLSVIIPSVLHFFILFLIISFQLNILRTTKFCILTIARSRLGLLHIIFRKAVTELWPLICIRFLLLLNIFRTNEQNFIKFCMIYINKI